MLTLALSGAIVSIQSSVTEIEKRTKKPKAENKTK